MPVGNSLNLKALALILAMLGGTTSAAPPAQEIESKIKRSDLVVKGRVVEYYGKCSAIACEERTYRIESTGVLDSKRPVADVDIAVLVVCGDVDLGLGKEYVLFLSGNLKRAKPSVEPDAEAIIEKLSCTYSFKHGDVYSSVGDGRYSEMPDLQGSQSNAGRASMLSEGEIRRIAGMLRQRESGAR